MRLKPTIRRLLYALLGLLLLTTPAQARPIQRPWNLAVVLDLSQSMGREWLGSSRVQVLERALGVELRSLPRRITAGLWAAAGGRVHRLIAPCSAARLKGVYLRLPRPGGHGAVTAALERAAGWLQKNGGGSLLLLTGPDPPAAPKALLDRLEKASVFWHIFAVAPGPAARRMRTAAAMGGGLLITSDRPADTARLLRRAVSAALSPTFVQVLTYDQNNRPLHLPFTLQRRDQAWGLVSGRAHRRLQLPSGVYRLSWPQGPPPSAAARARVVNIPRQGTVKLWIGGRCRLLIQARDARGRPLAWKVKVSDIDSGRLITPYKPAPLELSLSSGRYLVRSLSPAHQRQVELAAGQRVEMILGPPGRLTVKLAGPLGPVRLPYRVVDLRAGRRVATGYSNSPMVLLPGRYRLEPALYPPLVRQVVMPPGGRVVVELPLLGMLHIKRSRAAAARRYQVQTPSGRRVASGKGQRYLPLGPGRYLVVFGGGHAVAVQVRAGRLSTVTAPATESD